MRINITLPKATPPQGDRFDLEPQAFPKPSGSKRNIKKRFEEWLRQNKNRFEATIRVLNLFHRKNGHEVRILINGLNPNIRIIVYKSGISAWVFWKGYNWDCILDIDLYESQDSNGYFCRCCEDGSPRYLTIETLWAEHVFEYFLAWVNETLVRAKCLVIQGARDDITCAKLSENFSVDTSKPTGGRHWQNWTGVCLPLWPGKLTE